MRQQYKYEFSKGSSLVYELIPIFPRLIQVVNESRIGKWKSYYEFMMKAEGRKNHGVRIMHTPRTLLHVFYTAGMCQGKLEVRSKTSHRHEFIVLWHNLPFFQTRYKLQMLGAHSSCETKFVLCFHFPLPFWVDQISPPMYLSDKLHAKYLLVMTW
jgi:hypothetical protein